VSNRHRSGPDFSEVKEEAGVADGLLQDWVVGRLGPYHPIALDSSVAHGLLHRLDRDTSGLLLCAKNYQGYYSGQLQFETRNVRKSYVCLCHGFVHSSRHLLEYPLRARGQHSDVDPRGRCATTEIVVVAHFARDEGRGFSLTEIRLHTGRMHQIRAHLSHAGHALVGDNVYGDFPHPEWCRRTFLHAHEVCMCTKGGTVEAACTLPLDLKRALFQLHATQRSAIVLRDGNT